MWSPAFFIIQVYNSVVAMIKFCYRDFTAPTDLICWSLSYATITSEICLSQLPFWQITGTMFPTNWVFIFPGNSCWIIVLILLNILQLLMLHQYTITVISDWKLKPQTHKYLLNKHNSVYSKVDSDTSSRGPYCPYGAENDSWMVCIAHKNRRIYIYQPSQLHDHIINCL